MPLSMSTNFAILIRKLGYFVQQTSLMIRVLFFLTRLLSIIVNIFYQIKFLDSILKKEKRTNRAIWRNISFFRKRKWLFYICYFSLQEQLFVSKRSVFDGKKPIRGGIPFVFPVFGIPPDPHFPHHGFARIVRWTLEKGPERLHTGDVEAIFSLTDSEQTRMMWNCSFKVSYRLILREKELHMNIGVYNPGKETPFSFNLLLHTYFKCPDVRRCQVTGLHGCTFIDKTREPPNSYQVM